MFILFIYVPQWQARKRRQQQEADLEIGDQVMTIGGLIGTLTYFDPDENIARIRLAEDVVVDILPGAISGKRVKEDDQQATDDSVSLATTNEDGES
jgi:preprotein translocase YajC subunit